MSKFKIVAMTTNSDDYQLPVLCCPVCGYEQTHIRHVSQITTGKYAPIVLMKVSCEECHPGNPNVQQPELYKLFIYDRKGHTHAYWEIR